MNFGRISEAVCLYCLDLVKVFRVLWILGEVGGVLVWVSSGGVIEVGILMWKFWSRCLSTCCFNVVLFV